MAARTTPTCAKCAEYETWRNEVLPFKEPFQTRAVLAANSSGLLFNYSFGPANYNMRWVDEYVFPMCLSAVIEPIWFETTTHEDLRKATLLTANEMIKEGRGDEFTSEDRSIIMKAFVKEIPEEEAARRACRVLPADEAVLGRHGQAGQEADERRRGQEERQVRQDRGEARQEGRRQAVAALGQ